MVEVQFIVFISLYELKIYNVFENKVVNNSSLSIDWNSIVTSTHTYNN